MFNIWIDETKIQLQHVAPCGLFIWKKKICQCSGDGVAFNSWHCTFCQSTLYMELSQLDTVIKTQKHVWIKDVEEKMSFKDGLFACSPSPCAHWFSCVISDAAVTGATDWLTDWTGVKPTPGQMNTHGERGKKKKNDLINPSAEPQDTRGFNCIGQSSLERMSTGRDQSGVTYESLLRPRLFTLHNQNVSLPWSFVT